MLYEAHVRGLTMQHPQVPAEHRGTYLGLTAPAVLEHLVALGITAVELLPVHAHDDEARLRALGLTALARSPALPEVPTLHESGLKGYDASGWNAMFAPAGTPRSIIDRLQREAARALQGADVQARLQALGLDAGGGPPEQLAGFLAGEIAKWTRVAKRSGARVD